MVPRIRKGEGHAGRPPEADRSFSMGARGRPFARVRSHLGMISCHGLKRGENVLIERLILLKWENILRRFFSRSSAATLPLEAL